MVLKEFGAILVSSKIDLFKTMGYSLGFLLKNDSITDPCEMDFKLPPGVKNMFVSFQGFEFRKGPKSTVFEQKAWAIAHGFEQVGFWKFWKSLQTP